MKIRIELGEKSYDVIIERGALKKADEYLELKRKVLVLTDTGVPEKYAKALASKCEESYIMTIPEGEGSKSFFTLEKIEQTLLSLSFTRGDAVVAVGGGVVGDIAGFAASIYMRGIDFYNIPTTVLSQVDSSVGGKTAVNLGGVKNVVGSFYQPRRVLIDPDVLSTLPKRQISNGLSEALKMSLTFDSELFSLFESGDIEENLDRIIARSVELKASVVERDEREAGLRKTLNFGHTIGHGIEVTANRLYHGESVALGMIPMCSDSVRERLLPVLKALELPTSTDIDTDAVISAISHDKKSTSDGISVVLVEEIGSFVIKKMSISELEAIIKEKL